MTTVLRYAKAIVGAAAAGVAVYLTARTDGQVTTDEWLGILLAVLAGGGVVGAVPNKPKP
jgi:hypothetical protein